MVAYAVRITEENMWAIASEHPKFNPDEFRKWLDDHDGGYFLRDPSSVLDCNYFDDVVFFEMYAFAYPDQGALFRQVRKI